MALIDGFTTKLQGDTTLMALLTGGVYGGDVDEISRQNTAAAYDANGELKACALLRISTEARTGPYASSMRAFLNIYLYQQRGHSTIESARERIFALLDGWKPTGSIWEVRFADDTPYIREEALKCSLGISRYEVVRKR